MKCTAHQPRIVILSSITLLNQCTFSGALSQGGVYKGVLSTMMVAPVVCDSTVPCSEVSQVCTLNGQILDIDTKARNVKQYNPNNSSVTVLLESGHNSSSVRWGTRYMFIQTNRGDMLRRQDFVCYRCFRWKTEDNDEPLRNDISSGDSWLPVRYLWDSF